MCPATDCNHQVTSGKCVKCQMSKIEIDIRSKLASHNQNILVGDYVKVIRVPDAWELSGETIGDRASLVGHVGIVIKRISRISAVVRFPGLDKSDKSAHRDIELDALESVGNIHRPITRFYTKGVT